MGIVYSEVAAHAIQIDKSPRPAGGRIKKSPAKTGVFAG